MEGILRLYRLLIGQPNISVMVVLMRDCGDCEMFFTMFKGLCVGYVRDCVEGRWEGRKKGKEL